MVSLLFPVWLPWPDRDRFRAMCRAASDCFQPVFLFQEGPIRLSQSCVQRAGPSQRACCSQPPAHPAVSHAAQQPAALPVLSQAAASPSEAGRVPVAHHRLQRTAALRGSREAGGGLSADRPRPLRLQRGRAGRPEEEEPHDRRSLTAFSPFPKTTALSSQSEGCFFLFTFSCWKEVASL